jgi:hypothetical protein
MKRSEYIGLGVATIGHVGLFGVLSLSILNTSDSFERSEPIAVTLSDNIALADTSPRPDAEPATSIAPEIGEIVPPPEELTQPEDTPEEAETVPQPTPARTSTPKATAPAKVKPKPKPAAKKPPVPVNRSGRRRPDRRRTGSRLGSNFLDGVSDQESISRDQTPPAARAGPQVQASLQREITRKLKPKWRAPTGADAERLVTTVDWRLDKQGRVVGKPRCTKQNGVNASNRPQKDLHCERAIRAVLDAQPYSSLPVEYYDAWDNISYDFDRKL